MDQKLTPPDHTQPTDPGDNVRRQSICFHFKPLELSSCLSRSRDAKCQFAHEIPYLIGETEFW